MPLVLMVLMGMQMREAVNLGEKIDLKNKINKIKKKEGKEKEKK